MAGEQPSDRPRLTATLLVLLLAGGLAIRLWSASHKLDGGRFFDERYTLENVEAVLRHGQLRPANGFYLALSYLPQSALLAASEALHQATGVSAFAIWTADGARFSPTAYLICRSLNALVATASLWLTFLIGRRFWSPAAGLLAAAALAAAPRHLRCSVEYKPDIWVVCLSLLAFWWALAAAERPALRRFLRAGAGVGLALSAKYTGIGAALPVAVAGLARGGWRQPRRWGWTILSGCSAFATYLLLNPHLELILPYVPRVMAGYVRQSKRQGLSHTTLLLREGQFLVDNLGALVVAAAVAGAVLLVWLAVRKHDATAALAAPMLLVQMVGYSLFYAAATPLFRGQNYLPVVPLVALLAAFSIVAAASRLGKTSPRLVPPRLVPLGGALVALLVALSIADQARAVYVETVPTTWEAARRLIDQRLGRPIGRQIAFEPGERRLSLGAPRRRPLVHVVAELTAAAPRVLDGADAIAFPTHRLASGAGSSYRQRWEATPPDGRHRIDSGAFAARGESVTVLLHPWEPVATGTWTTLAPDGVLRLPPAVRGELLSLEVERRRRRTPAAALRLELGSRGGAVRLVPVGERLQREWLQSPRFPVPEDAAAARLAGPPEQRRGLRWRVVRWRRAS